MVVVEVFNGVWVGQEFGWDSLFNFGVYCVKGVVVCEYVYGECCFKYLMKKEGGEWKKISWEQVINEIGDQMMIICEESGLDSVYWFGLVKYNNEQVYLFCKFVVYWGMNNVDYQVCICYFMIVVGVVNIWGYGVMINSYNDIYNFKVVFIIGGNLVEVYLVFLLYVLCVKEQNNVLLIVCDLCFMCMVVYVDEYVWFCLGIDVVLIWGIFWYIFDNGWEDKEFICICVWGMDQIKEEVVKWMFEEVEWVIGMLGSQLKCVVCMLVNNCLGIVIWCMGGIQYINGNNNICVYCVFQLVLGNMGMIGGGINIFCGYDNVQGVIDFGVLFYILFGYYGLSVGFWVYWVCVWGEDFDWLKGQFVIMIGVDGKEKSLMNLMGILVSCWIDGVLEDLVNIDQLDKVWVMVLWGYVLNF